jgi:hypothetical protein
MSLDNIQLPAIVLQDLYKNALIDLQTENTDPGAEATVKFSYLGNNQQRVAIIVKNMAAIYLPEEELNFLLGILTACKLSMADIALVNISKNKSLNYTTLTEQLHADKILLFGVQPSELELPLQFPFYQVQKFNNQVYLSAPTLGQLEDDKAEKTKLWNCLKQVFAIG